MEMFWLTNSIIFLGLLFGSYTDFKKREVPDILNYSLICVGVFLGILNSLFIWSVWPLIWSLIGLGCGYLFGAAMFYTGQWGGGDAKMLMAIGALQGVNIISFRGGEIPLFFTTVLTILFVGSIYGVGYMFWIIFVNWKIFKKNYFSRLAELRRFRLYVLSCMVGLLLGSFFIQDLFIRSMFWLLLSLLFLGMHAIIAVKIVEKFCMTKEIPLSKATEGDWVVDDVFIDSERVCGPKDLGLTLESLETLKKHKIKIIKIKEGVPFIPGFFLGFICVLILGNWLNFLF